jgi:hypothetical protein
MNPHHNLEIELRALAQQRGDAAAHRALLVLARAVRWVRQEGHGAFELHAASHMFSLKPTSRTVYVIREDTD